MIKKIEPLVGNVLAIEIIDGYTESDEKLARKLFQEKIDEGFDHVHLLVRLDELKLNKSNVKAFMEDTIVTFREFEKIGNIAIVAHSNILKTLIAIDSFFFERLKKGFEERYFDTSQMDEALAFVSSKQPQENT